MSKKNLKGVVISNKMKKTIIVRVERWVRHPRYRKIHKKTKRYKVHDEENKCKIGDEVLVEEIRPISKEKRWRVVKRLV